MAIFYHLFLTLVVLHDCSNKGIVRIRHQQAGASLRIGKMDAFRLRTLFQIKAWNGVNTKTNRNKLDLKPLSRYNLTLNLALHHLGLLTAGCWHFQCAYAVPSSAWRQGWSNNGHLHILHWMFIVRLPWSCRPLLEWFMLQRTTILLQVQIIWKHMKAQ